MHFINSYIRKIKYVWAYTYGLMFVRFNKSRRIQEFNSKSCVYIDLQDINFHRYLYVLILFFIRKEYTVIINPKAQAIAWMRLDKYARRLFNHKKVKFYELSIEEKCLVLNDQNVSAQYFKKSTSRNVYHFPMCQHPVMYEQDLDEALPKDGKRINGLCFAGDFRKNLYNTISNRGFFDIPNRIQFIEKLRLNFNLVNTMTHRLLDVNVMQQKISLVDNQHLHLTPVEYRKFIASFDFFLALPGIHMPISHNIVEAMSLGTIPFIHQSYADCLHPAPIHLETAYIYSDFERIEKEIELLFQLSSDTIQTMRNQVISWFKDYYSVDAVIRNFEAQKWSEFRLNAEWNSIPPLKN